jgi:hypothetical protein
MMGPLLVLYIAASFLHFAHNAAQLDAYPNMFSFLTPLLVMVTWGTQMTIGLVGWVVLHRGHVRMGAGMIALCAVAGFDGLGHYALAPVRAHTPAMHLTIALEVASAAALLWCACSAWVGPRPLPSR